MENKTSNQTEKPQKNGARDLHQALDLLLARYINDTGKLLGETTIFDLMKWSHEQVLKEEGQ
jgi:hypothetical protein